MQHIVTLSYIRQGGLSKLHIKMIKQSCSPVCTQSGLLDSDLSSYVGSENVRFPLQKFWLKAKPPRVWWTALHCTGKRGSLKATSLLPPALPSTAPAVCLDPTPLMPAHDRTTREPFAPADCSISSRPPPWQHPLLQKTVSMQGAESLIVPRYFLEASRPLLFLETSSSWQTACGICWCCLKSPKINGPIK